MKERTVKRCGKCNSEFVNFIGTPMFARCPHCSNYLQFGNVSFVRIEEFISNSVWYLPWSWGSGIWVTKRPDDVKELERILNLKGSQ
jgi:hypothetical protein